MIVVAVVDAAAVASVDFEPMQVFVLDWPPKSHRSMAVHRSYRYPDGLTNPKTPEPV